MKTTGMNIDGYIKNHTDICYCEAIIYPYGTIEDAIPSHVMKLCEIYNSSKNIE